MMSVYAIFFAEVAAYRIGNKKMQKLGLTYNTHADAEAEHGHSHENHVNAVSPVGSSEEGVGSNAGTGSKAKMAEAGFASSDSLDNDAARTDYDVSTSEGIAQLIAVAVLEFGVILHSIVIGLTLALSDEFITLFIVIIFHRELLVAVRMFRNYRADPDVSSLIEMFEGLGLGSRLSQLRLPHRMRFAPYAAGVLYALMT